MQQDVLAIFQSTLVFRAPPTWLQKSFLCGLRMGVQTSKQTYSSIAEMTPKI